MKLSFDKDEVISPQRIPSLGMDFFFIFIHYSQKQDQRLKSQFLLNKADTVGLYETITKYL